MFSACRGGPFANRSQQVRPFSWRHNRYNRKLESFFLVLGICAQSFRGFWFFGVCSLLEVRELQRQQQQQHQADSVLGTAGVAPTHRLPPDVQRNLAIVHDYQQFLAGQRAASPTPTPLAAQQTQQQQQHEPQPTSPRFAAVGLEARGRSRQKGKFIGGLVSKVASAAKGALGAVKGLLGGGAKKKQVWHWGACEFAANPQVLRCFSLAHSCTLVTFC